MSWIGAALIGAVMGLTFWHLNADTAARRAYIAVNECRRVGYTEERAIYRCRNGEVYTWQDFPVHGR
jgi:hypothetical protein